MKRIMVGCLAVAVAMLVVACEKMQANADLHNNQQAQQEKAALDNIQESNVMVPGTVATVVVGPANFSVWVVESDEDRAKGLMNRESMPENQGMWFSFPVADKYQFWMKDTFIPLDWIYVEGDKVVAIRENNQPKDETPYKPDVPFSKLLEVNAGQVAKHGIKVGDPAQLRIGPK
jgi:uncharacterized protein